MVKLSKGSVIDPEKACQGLSEWWPEIPRYGFYMCGDEECEESCQLLSGCFKKQLLSGWSKWTLYYALI